MDLDHLIVAVFCLIDDALTLWHNAPQNAARNVASDTSGAPSAKGEEAFLLRSRGPAPVLTDSEVLAMEVVGAALGLNQDKRLFAYFRQHWSHFFPALSRLHRTTFTRQCANLWRLKEGLWQWFLTEVVDHDPELGIVDSFPLPVCRFARAPSCRAFRTQDNAAFALAAAFGKESGAGRRTFFGFRVHVRIAWPGVVAAVCLAPANMQELAALPGLCDSATPGSLLLGDRNYWSPQRRQEVAERSGVSLLALYKRRSHDPAPKNSRRINRLRWRIETTFGQLCDRYLLKQRVWARDTWHLVSRLLRVLLSHTLLVCLNQIEGNPPLQLERLVLPC